MPVTRLSMTVGMAVCALTLAACEPPPVGWSTEAVSVTADGTSTGNGGVNAFAISPDGTKVAFETLANNLGSVDTNGGPDIYVRDLTTGTTTLVSTDAAGTASANGPSTSPTFSPDGSSVAFTSRATNMDPGDTDGEADLYLADLGTGDVHVVTPGPADCGAGNTETPVFSADGSHIAFLRRWSWIDYSNTIDLYVHDLGTGADVSVTRTGTDPASCGLSGASSEPVFSEDGGTLVFVSTSRLVTTDLFFQPDIYAYDMDTQIPTLVSATPAGTNSMGSAAAPSISPSGTLIAFRSSGADLGPTDTNSVDDIYVRDLASGTTVLGSARTDGTAAGGAFLSRPTFDATGTRLAFSTSSSGLGPVDTAGSVDAYVRDLSSRTNHLVSVNAVGTDSARGASGNPMFLADGRVVFQSSSSDLGPPDAGADQDVYVRDLAAGTTTLLSRNRDGTDGGNGETSWFMVSADRTTVGMMSMASNLGPADGNGTRDLFVARYVRSADLQLDVTGGTDPVPPGGTVSLHATLSNPGPDVAGGTAVAVLVPPEVTVESLSSSVGTCQLTPVAAGVAACEIGDLAVDARVDLDIDLAIGGAVATDTVDVDIMAVSPTPDPQPGGGAVTVTIQIAT